MPTRVFHDGLIPLVTWLALSTALRGCSAADDPCGAPAAPPFTLVAEGPVTPPPRLTLAGRVTEARWRSAPRGFDLELRDAGGAAWRLRLDAPVDSLPAAWLVGDSIRAEIVAGWPAAVGLRITDEEGLVLAGASDQSVGGHVLADGLPGLDLSLDPADCPPRADGECIESAENFRLTVREKKDGQTAALMNGESARLGSLRVSCLIAQRVRYDPRCADAASPAVSWCLWREAAGPAISD